MCFLECFFQAKKVFSKLDLASIHAQPEVLLWDKNHKQRAPASEKSADFLRWSPGRNGTRHAAWQLESLVVGVYGKYWVVGSLEFEGGVVGSSRLEFAT